MSDIGILQKYTDLRVISNDERSASMQRRMGGMTRSQLDGLYVSHRGAGGALLLPDNESGEPAVLEVVPSTKGADSISVLYAAHPIVNDRQSYIDARRELIDTLNDTQEADEQGTAIWCPVRCRPTHITDLCLIQLVDIARKVTADFFNR